MTDSREVPFDSGAVHEWPVRPLLLALLGLAAGLIVHFLFGGSTDFPPNVARAAWISFVVVGTGLFAFTIERRLWPAALAFSLVAGAVAALVLYWNGAPEHWGATEGWRSVSLLLALAVAAPLFQSLRDEGALRLRYERVHDNAWTNLVLWSAAWAFVALTFLLALLLSQLFLLIKIRLLQDLLEKAWFIRALLGLSFGAAVGLLREHRQILSLLQRVAAMVLSVLAPVLAAGLALFLIALPFTGLDALWDATRATTPILLSCIVGALVLANAVIRDTPEDEARAVPLRVAAMALAVTTLPLAVIAAVATGLRIHQYGLTPERLWAVTFVAIASAYGLAYLTAVVRGRVGWGRFVRPANLVLAVVVCAVALLLSTPLISFNAISTRDQLARLRSGKVSPDKFDWAALAFDFGEPGRAAMERLKRSPDAKLRGLALAAGKADNRWAVGTQVGATIAAATLDQRLRVLPQPHPLPEGLHTLLASASICGSGQGSCLVYHQPGASEAFAFTSTCGKRGDDGQFCTYPKHLAQTNGKWQEWYEAPKSDSEAQLAAQRQALAQGKVEVRPVTRRQVFVGGVPVGDAFE